MFIGNGRESSEHSNLFIDSNIRPILGDHYVIDRHVLNWASGYNGHPSEAEELTNFLLENRTVVHTPHWKRLFYPGSVNGSSAANPYQENLQRILQSHDGKPRMRLVVLNGLGANTWRQYVCKYGPDAVCDWTNKKPSWEKKVMTIFAHAEDGTIVTGDPDLKEYATALGTKVYYLILGGELPETIDLDWRIQAEEEKRRMENQKSNPKYKS